MYAEWISESFVWQIMAVVKIMKYELCTATLEPRMISFTKWNQINLKEWAEVRWISFSMSSHVVVHVQSTCHSRYHALHSTALLPPLPSKYFNHCPDSSYLLSWRFSNQARSSDTSCAQSVGALINRIIPFSITYNLIGHGAEII